MTQPGDHILVVDDDPEIRNLLKEYLERNGCRVSCAGDGDGMWNVLAHEQIDLLVLDIMLPGRDGLDLCRELRNRSSIPVIMLTARGDEMDRILGLEIGADDYLPKPFSARELLARIKVIFRRTRELDANTSQVRTDQINFAGWSLDTQRQLLTSPAGIAVSLSQSEYELLYILLSHAGRVLSRDQLLDLTRGREAGPYDRSIDVLIGRLRRRLGDDAKNPLIINTVRGRGYMLNATVHPRPRGV